MNKTNVRLLVWRLLVWVTLFPGSLVSPCAATSARDAAVRCKALLEQDNLPAARQIITDALQQFPDDPNLYNLLGVIEARANSFTLAEKLFRHAIDLAPGFIGAYLNLGRLYQEHPDEPEAAGKALAVYHRLLREQPSNPEANYQTAVLLHARTAYRDSLTHLDRLPAEAQQRSNVLSLRCAAYAALRETQAVGDTARRLAEHPDLQDLDVAPILPSLYENQADEVALLLLEALDRRKLASPASTRALGLAYEGSGDLAKSRTVLEQAVQRLGVSGTLLYDLARVAYKQDDREGALGYLGHARDLNPESAPVHFFFGIVCAELNLVLDATESLQKAVALSPDNPYYNYAFGAVTMHADAGAALPYLKVFCDRQPANPHGRFTLGVAYYEAARFEESRKEMQALLSHPETAARARYYLGRMALQTGDAEAAAGHLGQAVEAEPQYPDAWAELGNARLRLKDFEAAREALDRAVKLDPENISANIQLLRLYRLTNDPLTEEQQQRFDRLNAERSKPEAWMLRRVVLKPYE